MQRAVRYLSLAVLLGFAAMAYAGHTHFPNSKWKLDVGASDFGGGPSMKSDVYDIKVDTEKWLSFTDTTVDSDGKTWKTSWSGPQDGTLKPVVGMEGAKASFKTEDDSSRFVMPDGSSQEGWMTPAPDKKSLTVKVKGKTKDGKEYQQTLVYRRVM